MWRRDLPRIVEKCIYGVNLHKTESMMLLPVESTLDRHSRRDGSSTEVLGTRGIACLLTCLPAKGGRWCTISVCVCQASRRSSGNPEPKIKLIALYTSTKLDIQTQVLLLLLLLRRTTSPFPVYSIRRKSIKSILGSETPLRSTSKTSSREPCHACTKYNAGLFAFD